MSLQSLESVQSVFTYVALMRMNGVQPSANGLYQIILTWSEWQAFRSDPMLNQMGLDNLQPCDLRRFIPTASMLVVEYKIMGAALYIPVEGTEKP